MFGKIFKYSLLGLTAWVVVANASPAYREAWKAKKSVDTTKEDGKWVINGDISMRRRIYGDVSVNYDFSVSSSRKSLWQ